MLATSTSTLLRRSAAGLWARGRAPATRAMSDMFCMQCEQTQDGTGCTTVGVCGKTPETAALQDLLLHYNTGLGSMAHAVRQNGGTVSDEVKEHLLDSSFATLTNVNFDPTRFHDYLRDANGAREQLRGAGASADTGAANFAYEDNNAFLDLEARAHGLEARQAAMGGNADVFGVREMAQYGLKGSMAYFAHAERLRAANPGAYSAEESDAVYDKIYAELDVLAQEQPSMDTVLALCDDVGATNVQVMELLDRAHTNTFGTPEPTNVSSIPSEGPAILVSGHDLVDLRDLLEQCKGTNVNVYTHGELLNAPSYPKLRAYPNLKGHYGNAWQKQKMDFARFPGPIVMTSNCLVEPRGAYADRIYTTNSVGWPGVNHIEGQDFSNVIAAAQSGKHFTERDVARGGTSVTDNFLVGFGHATVLGVADKVLDAAKTGKLSHIFLIGGCDGNEGERSYYTELATNTPQDSLVLTLGCGKYRVHGVDMGTLGGDPEGLPRLLDMGQCNDSYSAVAVALELAKALDTDINGLPLSLAVSWFEQKAVAVLLSLLHLGVTNIRLGPNLPAFVTPTVLQVLVDKYQIHPIGDPQEDMRNMMAGN